MNPTSYREVKRIVGEALDLGVGPAREAYLADAFEKDPSLKDEVLTLIEACEDSPPPFLERKSRDRLLGSRAGPYRFDELIGTGGMGAVYKATREDGAFRMVAAIKVVREGLDSATISKRFRNERQILARLSHPNIARLLDGGVTEDGRPFFVMEYVEGRRMNDAAASLGLYQKLDMFRILCKAVHYAHQNLVVHGDIKSNNVLVTADGTPKLLDFGVARLTESDLNAGLTQTYSPPAFTPDYASPEQVRGEALSTASDVYSLGVLLCELLTGKKPRQFTSPTPQSILRTIQTQAPTKPSELSGDSSLQGDLDNIVLKALDADPAQRYASAEQMAEDVRRYESGLPIIARPDSFRYRAGKFIRRNLTAVLAAGLGLLALTGGLATAVWQARIARIEKVRAERMFNDVRDLANSFIFEIERDIAKLPGSTDARAKLVMRATQYLDRLAQDSQGNPGLQRELASAYYKLGEVLGRPDAANLGDTAGALTSYRKAVQMREELANTLQSSEAHEDLAEAYTRYSAVLKVKGDYQGGLDFDKKALMIRLALHKVDPENPGRRRNLAESYTAVGGSLSQLGLWTEVLDARKKALEMYRRLASEDPSLTNRRGLALAANRMASIQSRVGDKHGAIKQYREVLNLRQIIAKENPNDVEARLSVAGTQMALGMTLTEAGQGNEAITLIGNSLDTYSTLAEADPHDARVHSLLSSALLRRAEAYSSTGAHEIAIALFRRSREIRDRLASENPLNAGARGQVAEVLAATGVTYEAMGQKAQALRCYQEARDIASNIEKLGQANTVIREIAAKSAKAVERLSR
jgi:tetratricopeptide (TPR) repeat protein/predicted Ser/Thr protein kinase